MLVKSSLAFIGSVPDLLLRIFLARDAPLYIAASTRGPR